MEGRIVLTHDWATMPAFAYQRILAGLPMPGLFVVSDLMPTGQAIDESSGQRCASSQEEWSDRGPSYPLLSLRLSRNYNHEADRRPQGTS